MLSTCGVLYCLKEDIKVVWGCDVMYLIRSCNFYMVCILFLGPAVWFKYDHTAPILFLGPAVWFKYDHTAPNFICTFTVNNAKYVFGMNTRMYVVQEWPRLTHHLTHKRVSKNMNNYNLHGGAWASTDQFCAPTCGGNRAYFFFPFALLIFFLFFFLHVFCFFSGVFFWQRGRSACTIGRLHAPSLIYNLRYVGM